MNYKVNKSIKVPKSKKHKSAYDEIPLEGLPVGGNYLYERIEVAKGQSKNYMARYSAIRNGVIQSAYDRGVLGIQVGIHKPKENPNLREIRIFRKEPEVQTENVI